MGVKLSIIVPCFNVIDTIDYCLSSLVADNFQFNYEVICVNDGSSDDTLVKLNEWQKRLPNIIKVIDSPHSNLSIARNIGIDNASGDWLFFVMQMII